MRYVIKEQPDGKYLVKDEWRNKVLVSDVSREYCDGFLAGIAAVGGDW